MRILIGLALLISLLFNISFIIVHKQEAEKMQEERIQFLLLQQKCKQQEKIIKNYSPFKKALQKG